MTAPNGDAALIEAWEQFRQLAIVGYRAGCTEEQSEAALEAQDAPDAILWSATPTTPHGVEVLLRRVLSAIDAQRWFDRALVYGDDETIKERISELDGQAQIVARCVLGLTAARHAAEPLVEKAPV